MSCVLNPCALAAAAAQAEMEADAAHIERLSERLLSGLSARLTHIVLNGDPSARYAGNLNVSFAYVEGESLLMGLKEARERAPRPAPTLSSYLAFPAASAVLPARSAGADVALSLRCYLALR